MAIPKDKTPLFTSRPVPAFTPAVRRYLPLIAPRGQDAYVRLCPMLRMGRPAPAFPPHRAPSTPPLHAPRGEGAFARLSPAHGPHSNLTPRREQNVPGTTFLNPLLTAKPQVVPGTFCG